MRIFASLLVGLLVPGLVHGQTKYGAVTLGHVTPKLEPALPSVTLRIDEHVAGRPWARSGDTIVVRAPGVLRVVDARTLRVVRSIPFRAFLCSLAFDGPAEVVVLSGCDKAWRTRFLVRRVDLASGTITSSVRTARIAPFWWPVSIAYGDGTFFLARPARGVDAIDADTGSVTSHPAIRTLSKGRGYVDAEWLGDHRLALGTSIVDVRNWLLVRHLRGGLHVASSPVYLVTWGRRGAGVYTRGARFLRHVLGSERVAEAVVDGGTLYALVGAAYDVVDLASGRRVGVLPQYFSELLPP